MDKKLNVCLMNDSFPPLIDGVANAVTNYARIISDGLGDVTVVTPDVPGAQYDGYPYPVVRYRSMAITEKLCGYRAGYPFSSSQLENLGNSGFNIIHSHCPFASSVMARVLREKTGIPIVFTYHTKFDIDIMRTLPSLMAEQTKKLILANIAACDEVWTVSHGAGENLRDLGYEGKYVVMENGVDFPRGRADSDEVAELRAEYGLTEGVPVFLFVGRLIWYKGIKTIIDSLRILSEKGIDYRMMFVGDGADRDEIEDYALESGIYDKCIFAGVVYDREDLRVYYTASDLFVFPSLYDTNGIVVREAAACGVASLLIEGSCAAEGITDRHTGILTLDDPQAIAKELEFACSHLDELHQIGENAMNEVYISWEDSVKRAYERYHVIIDRMNSGQTGRQEGFIQEEFFSTINRMTNSIQRVRSIRARMTRKGRHFGKRLMEKIKDDRK